MWYATKVQHCVGAVLMPAKCIVVCTLRDKIKWWADVTDNKVFLWFCDCYRCEDQNEI